MIGLAQGAFNKAVPYTYERKQFGQSVGTFQGMAFQIAEAAVQIEAARLLTYNAARRKEEGLSFTKEAAMAKYYASVVAQQVSGSAIEWAGGVGFTRETGIEKFWRDSKIVSDIWVRWISYAVVDTIRVGRNLRRYFEHTIEYNRKVYPEGVLVVPQETTLFG